LEPLYYSKNFTFNGDDALVIELDGVVTDVFGTPGMDPGSSWSGGGVETRNSNIALNTGITTGDVDGWTDPSERFMTVGTDGMDLTGFGVAPVTAAVCEVTGITISNISTCTNVGDDEDNSNDTFTFDAELTYNSVPTGDIIIRYFSGTTQVQAVQFPAENFPSPVALPANVAIAVAGELSATYEFVDDITCSGTFENLGTAPGPCSNTACAITNLVISDLRCGNNGAAPLDAYATVTFDVVNGSGNYSSLFEGTGGGVGLNLATDGEVTFDIQLTVGTVMYNDIIDIQIVDQSDLTCSATATGIVVPDCLVVCDMPDPPVVEDVVACEGESTLLEPTIAGGASCAATSDLIITAAFDGPLPGGDPKGIELYVVNDIADLSMYGVGSANNGGGTDGEE